MTRGGLIAVALIAAAGLAAGPARSDGRAHGCRAGQVTRCASPRAPRRQPPPPAAAPVPVSAVSASEREFSVVLSRDTVRAGTVFVEQRNSGMDPHDLRLRGPDGTEIAFATQQPGEHQSRKLSLSPGTWYLYCALPGHEDAGMHAALTATR
jgi:hypothetical protein